MVLSSDCCLCPCGSLRLAALQSQDHEQFVPSYVLVILRRKTHTPEPSAELIPYSFGRNFMSFLPYYIYGNAWFQCADDGKDFGIAFGFLHPGLLIHTQPSTPPGTIGAFLRNTRVPPRDRADSPTLIVASLRRTSCGAHDEKQRRNALPIHSGFPAFLYRDTFSTVYATAPLAGLATVVFYSDAAHRWAIPKFPISLMRRAPTAIEPNRPLTDPKSGS
ncbi:hypothetical protein EDB86DRAFT_2826960 [Lactarius hatsudake]|nr:hypothetical protein EDB86DRAFT_2826960 [Lactarius hatsudake]